MQDFRYVHDFEKQHSARRIRNNIEEYVKRVEKWDRKFFILSLTAL